MVPGVVTLDPKIELAEEKSDEEVAEITEGLNAVQISKPKKKKKKKPKTKAGSTHILIRFRQYRRNYNTTF